MTDHEKINGRAFTESQRRRVEYDRPVGGAPTLADSPLVLAAYRMTNGSRYVTLVDDSDDTWEKFCAEQRERALRAELKLLAAASWE